MKPYVISLLELWHSIQILMCKYIICNVKFFLTTYVMRQVHFVSWELTVNGRYFLDQEPLSVITIFFWSVFVVKYSLTLKSIGNKLSFIISSYLFSLCFGLHWRNFLKSKMLLKSSNWDRLSCYVNLWLCMFVYFRHLL